MYIAKCKIIENADDNESNFLRCDETVDSNKLFVYNESCKRHWNVDSNCTLHFMDFQWYLLCERFLCDRAKTQV